MNRKGFTYVLAIFVLGLLAFMGLFLTQSSSAEYSQASISVYRTMARQLAEAAGEEAFVMIEERFKDKSETGYFDQLIWQASTSNIPKNGGSTGLNPSLLQDFSDLNDRVTQTLTLRDYHMTRAGFEIEKILPTIKGCRPIPGGALDNPDNYHRSPDRSKGFDDHYSRDWYLVIQLDITIAMVKQRKFRIDYTVSRDVKLLNLGPMARNYTMFSILGHNINVSDNSAVQGVLRNELNSPDISGGRLILWNVPFQSRVYLHGPSIINLENPRLGQDRANHGAFNLGDPKKPEPGITQAYQYPDTFYGMSYFPTVGRAIFPPKNLWDVFAVWWRDKTPTKEDAGDNVQFYKGLFKDETVCGGILPNSSRGILDFFGDNALGNLQNTYFTGSNVHQKFLPAGPFCRTPWKYVSSILTEEDRFLPNSTVDVSSAIMKSFPKDDESLRLEHRWRSDDPKVAEQTKIYSRTYKIKYNNLTNNVKGEENLDEFSLSYYNNPDPDGFWAKLGYSASSFGESLWTTFTKPFQAVGMIVSPLTNLIFGKDGKVVDSESEKEFFNLYPTNFRYNYAGMVTRKFTDESQIPRDADGRWVLDGVYWLDSCQIDMSVTYIGTGTILVSQYNEDRPFKIRGSVVAARGENGIPLGHLNIYYHPYVLSSDYTNYMLLIEGVGNTIEASVYSCFGIRTTEGNISDLTTVGFKPDRPTSEWNIDFSEIKKRSNVIHGNYVNVYMNKDKQKGDLWIFHNNENPLYFDNMGGGNYRIAQEGIDASEEGRKKYEKMSHEFYMSPKLMHSAMIGGN